MSRSSSPPAFAARALALAEAHPHDFTLQYPPRREYFQERFRDASPPVAPPDADRLLVYVHVPFCAARCAYCNFEVEVRDDASLVERYVDATCTSLARLEDALPARTRISGIDIGGGTPFRLSATQLDRLLRALAPLRARGTERAARPGFVSIETTPEAAADLEKLSALRSHGVDRASVGLQSADPATLGRLGRVTSIDRHARAIEGLRAAGFARVNVDLIFGLPGQDATRWARDLEHALACGPDALTTYDCLYRGKGRALTRRALTVPSPAHYRQLYELGHERLAREGFHAPYGAVTFSRHEGESGTSAYFEARLLDGASYVGVGPYATSHHGDRWAFAVRGVERWIAAAQAGRVVGDAYLLPREEAMAKYLLLSLSFGRLDRDRFTRRFGEALGLRFGRRLAFAVERGWLREDARGFGLAQGRFDALPRLRALLYSDAAIDWLSGLRSDAA